MGALRTDRGGEFVSIKLRDFCKERGIQIRYTTPYLHEENGLVERGWRTLVTMKDALLIDSELPIDFWAKAMETANYLRNRLTTKTRGHGEVIPKEKWSGSRQNLSHFRIFGSEVLVDIPKEKRIKTDIQYVWRGILIGYNNKTNKHYRAWAPETKQVIVVSNPFINKSVQDAKLLLDWPLKTGSNSKQKATSKPKPRGRPRKMPILQQNLIPVVESEQAMSMAESTSKIYEPNTYDEAISDLIYGRRWRETIEAELQNLENHHTWEYEQLPNDRKTIGSKWVLKMKYHHNGSVARFKARLVAQGFSQVQGIDFPETFAPTVRRELLQIFLAISAMLGLIIHQVDIVGAYLESLLDDNEFPIYMKLPPGIHQFRQVQEGLLCRLLKSLYGLRQSGRLWNQNVIAFFKSLGFVQLNGDPSILMRQAKEETTLVSVYVDDFLLASNNTDTLETVKKELGKEYNVKDLGEIETIIGWQITRNPSTQTLKIDQSSFIRDLVIEENLTNCNSNVIPMKTGSAIEMIKHDDYEDTEIKPYQHLIGKLMYLACGTRPDIAFIVGLLSRHNADPKKGHLRVAKRVVRYLKGTMQLGLVYGRTSDGKSPTLPPPYGLIGYADNNFASDPKD